MAEYFKKRARTAYDDKDILLIINASRALINALRNSISLNNLSLYTETYGYLVDVINTNFDMLITKAYKTPYGVIQTLPGESHLPEHFLDGGATERRVKALKKEMRPQEIARKCGVLNDSEKNTHDSRNVDDYYTTLYWGNFDSHPPRSFFSYSGQSKPDSKKEDGDVSQDALLPPGFRPASPGFLKKPASSLATHKRPYNSVSELGKLDYEMQKSIVTSKLNELRSFIASIIDFKSGDDIHSIKGRNYKACYYLCDDKEFLKLASEFEDSNICPMILLFQAAQNYLRALENSVSLDELHETSTYKFLKIILEKYQEFKDMLYEPMNVVDASGFEKREAFRSKEMMELFDKVRVETGRCNLGVTTLVKSTVDGRPKQFSQFNPG